MAFIDEWQAQLNASYAQFAQLVADAQDIDLNSLIATAILWPVRRAFEEDEGFDTLSELCGGAKASQVVRAIDDWSDDQLAAAHNLAVQTQTNEKLRAALTVLINHFQAHSSFVEPLAQALVKRQGGGNIYTISEQIKAALVNIGGTTTISSLTLNFAPATPSRQLLIPPPPEPARPPEVPHFVGREAELADFMDKLTRFHLAIIIGMAGVGKTALGATLARRQQLTEPAKVFWHTFRKDEGVYTIIWQLAGFLAWHGQQEPWEMLQSLQQIGGQPQPPQVLFDYLFQSMRGQGYLLCLDNFQFIDDDPQVNALAEQLRPAVLAGELSLIIISRRLPDFSQTGLADPLAGLSEVDTRHLLSQRGLSLSEELVAELYARTEGNAQLLILASSILKRANDPRNVVTYLIKADNVTQYLIQRVDKDLTETDREIMIAVAILLGYPGSREVIEAVANRSRLKPLLVRLSRENLLIAQAGQAEPVYNEHALVREFYYDVPSRPERREMHRRAAQYYETETPDWLQAARHYDQAENYKQAARLATLDIWSLINQGQARALRRLLEQFTAAQLGPELWVQVKLALGEIYTWLGEVQLAQESYQVALDGLASRPDSATVRTLKVRACLGLGSLLRYQTPAEALPWLEQGLTELAGADPEQAAALHIEMGLGQINLGDFAAAADSLAQGLRLLAGVEAPRLRVTVLINLGNVAAAQGDLRAANRYNRQALQLSEAMGDTFRTVTIWQNMGIDEETAGQWEAARAKYQQALALAERLGGVERLMGLNLSLGMLTMKQGQDEAALAHLTHCLSLARQHNLPVYVAWAASSLADLHLRRGEPAAAAPLLAEAERLAQAREAKEVLPEIYRELAQLHLASADLPAALSYAEQSIHLARDQAMIPEEGLSQRVLGQIRLAAGQVEPAIAAFQHSLALLESSDPYETARTQAAWGSYLATGPDPVQGTTLLEAARATFEQLGANRDLTEVDEASRRF